MKPRIPKYSLGARYNSKFDEIDKSPGVGQYTSHPNLFVTSKPCSIGKSSRFQSPNKHPGVGDYEVSNKNGLISGKGTMDKSPRDPLKKPDYPGRTSIII